MPEPRFAGAPLAGPAAGAAENPAALKLALDLVRPFEPLVALCAEGNVLADAYVMPGDVVLLAPAAAVHDGEVVAVTVTGDDAGEAVAIGRYFGRGRRVRLEALRPGATAREYAADRVRIQGRVVIVVRQIG
jgi:repressor LexA